MLVRLANSDDALYSVAYRAVTLLQQQQSVLCITPQNLIEFRSVASRPHRENGLGYSIERVAEITAEYESLFTLLEENERIYTTWKELVQEAQIIGKQVHDARWAACCKVYALNRVLTFNGAHFARFALFLDDWRVLDPHTL